MIALNLPELPNAIEPTWMPLARGERGRADSKNQRDEQQADMELPYRRMGCMHGMGAVYRYKQCGDTPRVLSVHWLLEA